MPTEKLYWEDPFAMAFEARGAAVSVFAGRPSLVLPATRFYPEAGGQLGDTGTLEVGEARIEVTDTQITGDGVIHHLVSAPPSPDTWPAAAPVRGAVDRDRRLDHMAHHTAQHMLSAALAEAARAETVSARLGRASCTIDLDVPGVADRTLALAEDRVNAVIRDDVPVRAFFPTASELAGLRLRRAPKVSEGIRVIDIEGFDQSPCGGTHCTRTGQLGLVRIVGVEKYKGKIRLTFHAAARALADARSKEAVLSAVMGDLTCGAPDVITAIARLKAELRAAREGLGLARAELATRVADEALAAHPPPANGGDTRIVVTRERDDTPTLRVLAARLASRSDVVAICMSPDGDAGDFAVVVQRGIASHFDCGAWLKRVASELGGRGGGRPERAEGRLSATAALAVPTRAP
jgi:alanyl-tRNA synthetase